MLLQCTRAALLALCLITGCRAGGCFAGELADFNAAVEQASIPLRAALEQLNAGDTGAARTEVERMRAAWATLVDRFGARPPDAFDGNELYATTLTDVSTRIANALKAIKAHRFDEARATLLGIRTALSQMRRASGIVVLADCILDANAALEAFAAYKDKPPDWSKTETRFDVAAKATIYRYELQRCDTMASGELRADPQFRRLIDGALAGLALVPTAINTRDSELLGRIVAELHSFDSQLTMRFG
jgi:hypothetical protein